MIKTTQIPKTNPQNKQPRPSTATATPKERRICIFGLHPIWNISKPSTQKPLPLETVDIKVHIQQSTARVEFTQVYVNNTKDLLETEYFFPIPYESCFDSFKATYEGVTITGVIKDKKQAKHEYNQNVSKGNTVAYAEINEQANDIMKVNIGNIQPSARIEISFSYQQHLEIMRNMFYSFTFYSTLTNRYRGSRRCSKTPEDSIMLSSYPFLPSKKGPAWSLEATVTCSSPITYFECSSHKTESDAFDNPCQKKIRIVPASDELVLDKDFTLFYSESDFNIPSYRLAKNETGYCAMVEFVPKFSDKPLDEVLKDKKKMQVKQVQEDDDEMNLMTATGEYIFLIDRSGSMQGARIDMAKEALLFALKSLPPNSHFNVVSFGTNHTKLFTSSVESTEKNVQTAIDSIRTFGANMGGTQILNPLLFALAAPRIKYHPRSVFLLTDGAVNNTQQILDQITLYSHRNRVFTLGIGNGCSTELVSGCAQQGKGKAQFVADSNQITGSVISLMSAAVVPVCDDFSLEFSDKSCVTMIAPDPISQMYLLRNERATFFVFLDNKVIEKGLTFDIKLRCFDSFIHSYHQNVITVDLENYEASLDIFKLGISNVASVLNKREQGLSKEVPDIYWAGKKSIDEEIINLSVANQVLTKKTAFICVVKENSKDDTKGLKKVKEIVPQVLSSDYKISPMQYYEEDSIYGHIKYKRNMNSGPQLLTKSFARSVTMKQMALSSPLSNSVQLESEKTRNNALFKPHSISSAKISAISKTNQDDERCYEEETKKSETKSATSDSGLLTVIESQKMLGYWEKTPHLLQILGLTEEKLDQDTSTILKDISGSKDQIAITLVILVWLERHHQKMKSGWIMIHKKGQQWLKAQGVKYAEVESQISCI